MAHSSSETNLNRLEYPSSIPLFQRLSLRSVKGIAVGFLLCTGLGFLLLCRPAYLQLKSLQKEKTSLQHVMNASVTNTKTTIPTMDQLPDMIEQCRGAFVNEGVNVVDINVERFGERRETGKEASLDHGLVRFRLRGNWEGIVLSLKALEKTQEGNIHVQEVVLAAEGGDVLLQIYFCAGE